MVDLIFTDRPTSESSADPLKVVPEGSMVEYISVGTNEGDPKSLLAKKSSQKFLNHIPIQALCAMTFNIFYDPY